MKLPKTMPAPMRHKSQPRRPVWILVLVALVSISLIAAYVYPPGHQSTCYFFSLRLCSPFKDWLPPLSARVLSDDELASSVVIRDILSLPSVPAKKPKGHEGKYSIYVHASRTKPVHVSSLFVGREIRSDVLFIFSQFRLSSIILFFLSYFVVVHGFLKMKTREMRASFIILDVSYGPYIITQYIFNTVHCSILFILSMIPALESEAIKEITIKL